jgi:hypothetical protein
MIIRVRNTLDQIAPYSFLSTGEVSGAGTLRVQNISAYSASWAIQIGKTGEEKSEVKLLGTATPSGTSVILTGTINYDHPTDTPVYAIKYDQVVFERSTSGTSGTATPMTGGTITITSDSDYTQFDDTSGATTYAYRTYFRNSVTTENSSESDWMTSAGFSFYSLARMRDRTKAKLHSAGYIKTDDVIDNWINEWMEKMSNVAISVNKDYMIGTADYAFGTSGLGTITDTLFKEVRRIWITYNGSDYYQATKMDIIDFTPNETFNSSHPYFYYEGDNVFGIKPPESGGTARVTYYKYNALLTNDTDELPVVMRGYTKSFVDYALGNAYLLDDKDQKGAMFLKNADVELERFRNEITPRSKTGPQTINVTDSIDGDDNSYQDFI